MKEKKIPMLEKLNGKKTQIKTQLTEAKLIKPFKLRFKVLMYLKQKNDFGLSTTDLDIVKNCKFNLHDTRSFLRKLEQINFVKKTNKRTYCITEKGERYLYETILPIFAKNQKIAKKIFFGEQLLQGEKICQEKKNCLDQAFSNLIQSSISWFKLWLEKEFGESMAFEEWFFVFEKEHTEFLKQQLENEKKAIDKNRRNT